MSTKYGVPGWPEPVQDEREYDPDLAFDLWRENEREREEQEAEWDRHRMMGMDW